LCLVERPNEGDISFVYGSSHADALVGFYGISKEIRRLVQKHHSENN